MMHKVYYVKKSAPISNTTATNSTSNIITTNTIPKNTLDTPITHAPPVVDTCTTKVVSVRKRDLYKQGYDDFASWAKAPSNVYIGRQVSYPDVNAPQSKWANPFKVDKYGRDECIRLYEEHLKNSKLYDQLEELDGKVLGCWCKPEPCHGDILVKVLKEKKEKKKALIEKGNQPQQNTK